MFLNYLLYEEDGVALAYGRDDIDGIEYHEVKEGETLRDIAREHYGDPDLWFVIRDYNGLDNAYVLSEGSTLEIPLL